MTLGSYSRSVRTGILVWLVYSVLESGVLSLFQVFRAAIYSLGFHGIPPDNGVFLSAALSALTLLVYPLVGAAIGFVVAVVLKQIGPIRGARGNEYPADAWMRVHCCLLLLIVAVQSAFVGEGSVSVAVLALLAISLVLSLTASRVTRVRIFHDALAGWSILLAGIVVALVAQPRPNVSGTAALALAFGCAIGAVLFGEISRRVWREIGRIVPSNGARGALIASGWLVLILWPAISTPSVLRSSPSRGEVPAGGVLKPNVVLVTLDTVRVDHLSLYGYARDTTPYLKQFATSGAVVYTQAIASSNCTDSSHASIFTGLIASRHGAFRSDGKPRGIAQQTKITLGEYLTDEGYDSGAVVANIAVLLPAYGFDRGFRYYDVLRLEDALTPTGRPYLLKDWLRRSLARATAPSRIDSVFVDAAAVNSQAATFIRSATSRRRPFFLFLNYMDAHTPYSPPEPFLNLFATTERRFQWKRFEELKKAVQRKPLTDATESELEMLVSRYDGAIAYIDGQLKQLFTTLHAIGAFDNTLIIITSDHGEAFGEHSYLGHCRSVYDSEVHVPLIVKNPNSHRGSISTRLASSIDLFPTIVDIVGGRVPDGLDGISLRSADLGSRAGVLSESYAGGLQRGTMIEAQPTEAALVTDRLKMVAAPKGIIGLYDRQDDPLESTNLWGPKSGPTELSRQLETLMQKAAARRPGPLLTDPDVMNRLRALGYVK